MSEPTGPSITVHPLIIEAAEEALPDRRPLEGVVIPPQRPLSEGEALDIIAHWLRDPEWGVGMLEDIGQVVTATGRDISNLPGDQPTWGRH